MAAAAELWEAIQSPKKASGDGIPDEISTHSTLTLNDGKEMPVFGLGTWRSETGKVQAAVAHALKSGKYKQIDCAQCYQNQEEVGRGIAEAISSGSITREHLWVTSKLWCTHYRPEVVRPTCEATLKELGLTYLDQYLLHWPLAFVKPAGDEFVECPRCPDKHPLLDNVDYLDTYKELEKLVDAGLVKSIGISNFSKEETQRVLDNCRIKPAVNQVEMHPYWNNNDLKEYCEARGIKMVAYSPLGNVNAGEADSITPLDDPKVRLIAATHMKSPAQVLIRWAMQRGTVVIPKSVTLSRIDENADVNFQLSAEEMATIEELGEKKLRQLNPRFRAGSALVFNDPPKEPERVSLMPKNEDAKDIPLSP